jgi:hypothetical protein
MSEQHPNDSTDRTDSEQLRQAGERMGSAVGTAIARTHSHQAESR